MNNSNDRPSNTGPSPYDGPQQAYPQGYPSYPQQQQSTMQKLQSAWSWYMRRGKAGKIGIGCGGLFVLMMACTICSAAMAGITGANHDTTTAQSATVASTQAPQPTHQVVKLPTPTPTPKPKPLTPEQVLNNIAQDQVLSHQTTTTFDGTAVIVTAKASDNLTEKMIAQGCQIDAFNVEKALWTSGKLPSNVTEVDVHLTGDLQDKFGNTSTGNWAAVTLSKSTEQQFNWANLDQTSAWGDYDTAFLVANLRQALDS
jgi:hypothetical protein